MSTVADGVLNVRAWPVQDAHAVERAATGVVEQLHLSHSAAAGPAETNLLEGTSGRIWMAKVDHERTSWGCVSSEVRVVSQTGRPHSYLHVVARECTHHGIDDPTDNHDLGFAAAVAQAAGVAVHGVDPFRVGHTTVATVRRLVAMLRDPERTVPIILVSGPSAPERAAQLSARATGAALAATIDGDASWRLSEHLGATMGCYAGALRVYPPFGSDGRTPDCPVWVSRRVAHQGWHAVADQVVATVAPFGRAHRRIPLEVELERETASVALRRATATIDDLKRELASRSQVPAQVPDEDLEAIFDAQNERIEALEQELEQEQLSKLDLEERLENAEAANESLRLALTHHTWNATDSSSTEVLAVIDPSVEAAIERLGDPDGALVCTENALRSWRNAEYPLPDRMLDAVRRLESAAGEWRAAETHIGGRLGEWLQNLTGLRFAGSDQELERRSLDTFVFEEQSWSRLLHIKVDDAKHSNQVGRIYFAIDSERQRWIVDHVGQKLYGR